uniref:STING ligand-binding domain-containing protein n=1 Tax=Graphocephala atropunctata TaxID=36148 RepID=A0A1B6MTB8_9HEMI
MAYKKIPHRRNNATYDKGLLFAVHVFLFGVAPMLTKTSWFHLCVLSLVQSSFLFVAHKIVLFLREIYWYKKYASIGDFLLKILKIYNWRSVLCAHIPIIGILLYHWHDENIQFQELWNGEKVIFSLLDTAICLPVAVLGLYFQWNDCPLTISYRLEESGSFSGGSSMARGFFHGYLKIILPGLFDEIEKFQNFNNLTDEDIPVKRLIVLIPSSTFLFDKLRKDSAEPLPDSLGAIITHRVMVLNRVYKNTLYKIPDKDSGKSYYIVVEGATPLKTFQETCTHEPHFKDFKQEVISAFYYELVTLINEDKNVKDFVDLLYYDDEEDPDIEIADLVCQRIKLLKKLEKSKKKKRKSL